MRHVCRIKHFDWQVFQYKNHSQNSYASKSLQFYVKWINMNWKLIHMISTNTMQGVEGVVHVFIVCLVVLCSSERPWSRVV